MEADKCQDMPSTNGRTRKASGIVWANTKGLRTRVDRIYQIMVSVGLITSSFDCPRGERTHR